MRKSNFILSLMAIVRLSSLLVVMMAMSPTRMWAEDKLEVKDGDNITISEELVPYNEVYIEGGTLIIKNGAMVVMSEGGRFIVHDGTVIIESGATVDAYFCIQGGKTFNYGTIHGDFQLYDCGYCFANWGNVEGNVYNNVSFYNFGNVTYCSNTNNVSDNCNNGHYRSTISAATCTDAGFTRCNECGSISGITPALGHDYQVVKDDQGNATWTWAEDYSTATLQVACTHNAEHKDNQETTDITSAVTTQPTTEATGVRTYTAKVTYGGVEYVGTKTEVIPVLHAVSVVVGEHNYTTFYDGVYNMIIPEGFKAWTATVQGPEIIYSELSNVIPAGTGVLLYHKGAIQTDFLSSLDIVDNTVADNVFFGYDADNTPTSSVFKYYKLQYSEVENRVGFYYGAEGGAPFLCKAHKAYLAVSSSMPAKQFADLPMDEDDVTAIDLTPTYSDREGAVYNLSGQKVSPNYKGIVIKNGKKVMQ